ncbi:MAG: hypothetical protein HAW67_00250, partial [Endozoicomonadaceae bacterium]|nr:hypothetical protein [Endozoicomonadaceae bacterium]
MKNKKPQPPLATIERKFSVLSDTAINLDIESNTKPENTENQDDTSTKNIPDAIKALIKRRCE